MTHDQSQYDPDLSILNDLFAVLQRRKLTIILVMFAVIFGAYGVVNYLTEQYESEARLMVMLGRENTEVPLTVENGGVFNSGIREEEVNSYVQLIQSRTLIEKTVDDVGVDRFDFSLPEPETLFQKVKYTVKTVARGAKKGISNTLIVLQLKEELDDRQKVINLVQGALSVQREGSSNVIRVVIRLPSNELAAAVLEQHIENYFERHVSLRNSSSVFQLFNDQNISFRSELAELQQRKAGIRQEWHLSDVNAQRAELLQRLNSLEADADDKRSELAKLEQERAMMGEIFDTIPERLIMSETVEPNPAILKLKENLIEKRLDLIDLSGRYRDGFPLLETVQNAIDELDALLADENITQTGELTYAPHPLRVRFEQDLKQVSVQAAGLRASLGERELQIERVSERLARLNIGEDLLLEAELDRSLAESRFRSNNARREQAMISGELDAIGVANVVVLSAPSSPTEPVSPKKLLIMGVAIGAGLLLGFGLALVFEWTDDTIHSARDLQTGTDLPYIGEFRMTS